MFDAPDRCVTRDVVPAEHWGADPCSSKDSASRMNSPRNSKSSGTPQISPEPKELCFGAEVDMEEDDGSSHSGQAEGRQEKHSECRPRSPNYRRKFEEQLKQFADSRIHEDVTTRDATCDEADSNSERHSDHLQPENCPATTAGLETEARSGQSVHAAPLPRVLKREGLPGRANAKSGESQRQKGLPRASPVQQPDDPVLDDSCLQRLQAVDHDPCQLASEALQSLHCPPAAVLKEALPEEALHEDPAAESLSRACSTAPAREMASDEAEEALPSKKQRSSKKRAAAPLHAKRGNRAPASGHSSEGRDNGSLDEDYLPPGEAGEHVQQAPAKRARLQKGARAICKSDSLPAVVPSAATRQPVRLRWSASVGPASPPMVAASACRRLRSQPVDLTDIRPDAFAFWPPSKRPRHAALHQGILSLQQLGDAQATPLIRSRASGMAKPVPQWTGHSDQQLVEPVTASFTQRKARQDADCKLMDSVRPRGRVDAAALSERLGQSPLGKALRSLDPAEGPPVLPADEILPSCKQLFPAFMAASLASWESRMESTYVSVFGEAAPCILARQQRDAHNAWDDLLARQALETETIEILEDWLQLK